ncbi:protein kinase [Candidatus Uabimicrobium sp. HlEnr_7]|uniref:protein kinase domain-containing protein n=1 Tax=Candidatus Uabimicrobium helgolandensis TaxID=3095367 RepID=UPI0035571F79
MSGEISINCSNCSKTLSVIPSDVERIIKCNYCNTFLKVPARKSKRLEMPCPACSANLNIPLKLRGKICSCWSCGTEITIPKPAELIIEEISIPQSVEQGAQSCEIRMKILNVGMQAEITGIDVAFEKGGQDLNTYFTIKDVNGSSSTVSEKEPVTIVCVFEVAENAPAGKVNIHIKISGLDNADKKPTAIETRVQTSIGYNRVFAVVTENELCEKAGSPFAVQLWACLENGEVDADFSGNYNIAFSISDTPTSSGIEAQYPKTLQMEFIEGVATSDSDFILYNCADSTQIMATEKDSGVGEGYTDYIQLEPSAFLGFAIDLTSPQMNGCLFQGINQIRAVDKFGNIIPGFDKDVSISPSGHNGELYIDGKSSSVIAGNHFKNGIIDLTSLKLSYTTTQEKLLPCQESFVVSCHGQGTTSSEIVIENNILEIFIEKVDAPQSIEQGQNFSMEIQAFNSSSMDVKISKLSIDFQQNGQQVNHFFDISAPAGTRELKAAARNTLQFQVNPHQDTPFGEYNIEIYLETQDSTSVFRAKKRHSQQLYIEPSGRVFSVSSTDENKIVAGDNISLTFACYLSNVLDTSYHGKKRLHFESNASPSANASEPFIPSFVDVEFNNGVAEVVGQVSFTNAQEKPVLKIEDSAPGGAKGELSFDVKASELASFWFVLEPTQRNMELFAGKNFVMAMDAFGNLNPNFAENCEILSASGKGLIAFGDEAGIIPAESFKKGIADLTTLQACYRADVSEKLPKEEQLKIVYGDVISTSEKIIITPKPAELCINRITAPEKVDRDLSYQISLEIENKGNKSASISTILFNFQNEHDVSSHYVVTPVNNHTEELLPFVPFLATFNVKTGKEAPSGMTTIEVTVAGIDKENIPLRSSNAIQWLVEEKERSIVITTQNKNVETAGKQFALKLEVLREDVRDQSFNGSITFLCTTNATASKNGDLHQIPDSIAVNFVNGEAHTEPVFFLTNTLEQPSIYFRTTDGKMQTSTSKIQLQADTIDSLDFRIAPNIRVGEVLIGENAIHTLDKYGNLIPNFKNHVQVTLSGVDGQIYDMNDQPKTVLEGHLFENGILNLSHQQLKIDCVSSQVLPQKAQLVCVINNTTYESPEFRILARPINLHIDEVMSPSQVLSNNNYIIEIKIRNDGNEVKLSSSSFSFVQNGSPDNTYKVAPHPQNLETLPKGVTSLQYNINIADDAGQGTTEINTQLKFQDSSGKEITCDRSFRWFVEASGRSFSIDIPKGVTAGKPFAIKIHAERDNEKDLQYEGSKILVFNSNAKPAPNGVERNIPSELELEFQEGTGSTAEVFTFVNADEQVVIEVEEKQGSTSGLSGTIEIKAAELGKFAIYLSTPQINESPLQGKNVITAKDVYGNTKSDFKESIQLRPQSGKGEFYLPQQDIINTIPDTTFQNGSVDLTQLGIVYRGNINDVLPKEDQFFASYQDKQGQSNAIVVEPRPIHVELQEIKFVEKLFQGDLVCPISFDVQNCSDQALDLSKVSFKFIDKETEEDISSYFTVSSHPNNPKTLLRSNHSQLAYHIDVDSEAKTGEIVLEIEPTVTDSSTGKELSVIEKCTFSLSEKPRTFIIKTENDNNEKVGESFYLILCAYKDGQMDVSYNGIHKIYFSSSAGNMGNHNARIPEYESVEFKQGMAKTKRSFMFVKAQQKPIITALEKGKAEGSSEEIVLQPGSIQSLKIVFPKKEEERKSSYLLKPLDDYGNTLNQQYSIDEDIKPGVMLSGSRGNFYEILDLIGHGAMGKVYRARRLNDNFIVAIKSTMFSALSDINRFILEAVMLIQFDHPNIVKGYDVRQICSIEKGKPELKFYMMMEFLTGQSVKTIIDSSRDGILSPVHATKIILHTARALKYIWDRKTIHRDIKPENIQITKDDHVKLLDLGIARAEGGITDISITRDDTIVGSYPYISPERLKNNNIDYRADIYSLGSTYYHMLTGMPPYLDSYDGRGGKDLLDYLIRIRTKRAPTAPDKLEPRIPSSVSSVIMTMLSIKPTRRYRDSEEMLSVLEKLYQEISSSK